MKSGVAGKSTSEVEVTHISAHGIWLLADRHEYYLPYSTFPWFKDAKLSDIQNVRMERGEYLFWPSMGVDLELNSIEDPEKYPLHYR